jgi:hypothetical protein
MVSDETYYRRIDFDLYFSFSSPDLSHGGRLTITMGSVGGHGRWLRSQETPGMGYWLLPAMTYQGNGAGGGRGS